MSSRFEIARTKMEPGTKNRNYLRVGPYFHHKRAYIRRYVLIPFTIIRGREHGPTLVQTAGCHPTEYAGIDATITLANTIKPEDLKGTYIAVHCVNTLGFSERTYLNPIDGKNIHELYPGRADGTISEMIAYRLFNEIVLKANYFLDCHGGDIHESEIWSVIYHVANDDAEKKSEAIARATGITYIDGPKNRPGTMGMEAAKRGIPGAQFEISSGDRLLPEESSAIVNGTLNVLRHLKMLPGAPKPIQGQPGTVAGQEQEIWTSRAVGYFRHGGLYHTNVRPGDILKEGQVIGTVTDWWGEVVETIYSPGTGRVAQLIHNPVVLPGDTAIEVVS